MSVEPDWRERARAIRLLVLDVDGVLTDGTLYYSEAGEALKAFHVHDGLGIKLLELAEIGVAVITARSGGPLGRRLRELEVEYAWTGREDKGVALTELADTLRIEMSQVAYVGDDVTDLPVLRRVGLPITVSNGHALVKAECAWVTERGGGRGAVREIADGLLDTQGVLKQTVDAYLAAQGGGS